MNAFRTEFTVPVSPWKLTPASRVVSLGSCFADVVATRLTDARLSCLHNPFGTQFHPPALFRLIRAALSETEPDGRLFLQHDGRWLHYEAHSSVAGATREELEEELRRRLAVLGEALRTADVLLLTFGSAWVYQLQEPPVYVANCHKQPSGLFVRDLISVKDICRDFGKTYKLLKELRPDLRIVLTVSPVRHGKDGMPDNAVSKSILRAACHYLTTDYSDVSYFPAYELLLDDLRDYRFYADDLLHPSRQAEQYIFEKFAGAYFDSALHHWLAEWARIRKSLDHRPFNPASEAHLSFLRKLLQSLEEWADGPDTSAEQEEVRKRITTILSSSNLS